ncbi:glycosyl hydrolase [Aquabacterium sp. OR-4]|uniref:glycosyl hydrolase n=1 Tax=Aquabacterium sp. OR-4 TaxID=2978127 RepID=UPI0028C6763E|nr:glycosyl hydrolase [Aquabacterium sp. OR-4]MDT7836610.1 glycosyl hydrolase [Aquabacterium sp. OR-4]
MTMVLAALPALTVASGPALMPYKDVSLAIDPATPRIATAVHGGPPALLPGGPGQPSQPDGRLPGGAQALVWAFATGECGQERWGPFDTEAFAGLNVAAFAAAGVPYIVATGGEAGGFHCASNAGMARFLARYDSALLRGIDFDIERDQSDAQIADLMARVAFGLRHRPGLRWSVTLATHAATDGSHQSLNATGERVLAAARSAGVLAHLVVNLMVMNYGPAQPRHCPLREAAAGAAAACDMGAAGLQAARNVQARHGIALSRIALTPMLGRNDVADNRFSLADARRLAADVRASGLEGLHFWSLDRDRACAGDADALSPLCHGLPGLAPLGYSRAMAQALAEALAGTAAR